MGRRWAIFLLKLGHTLGSWLILFLIGPAWNQSNVPYGCESSIFCANTGSDLRRESVCHWDISEQSENDAPGQTEAEHEAYKNNGKEDVSPKAEWAAGWNAAVPESND